MSRVLTLPYSLLLVGPVSMVTVHNVFDELFLNGNIVSAYYY